MTHVFISHASEDAAAALAIVRAIEAEGGSCWIAPRDIRPGSDYRESILAAIDDSTAMIVLLSNHASASPHVVREVHRAVDRRVLMVPVRLEEVRLSPQLEYDLSVLQWIDAFPGPMERHTSRVLAGLVSSQRAIPSNIAAEPSSSDSARRPPRWEHRLTPALHFVGRRDAIGRMQQFLSRDEGKGVLGIIGIGGAGKTSMVEQFLQDLEDGTVKPPASLFGWSFYESIDSAALLEALGDYHDLPQAVDRSPQRLLSQLKRRWAESGERHLLVLDGMERVQQERSSGPRARRSFGEIVDPLVRDLIRSVAAGVGRTTILATSRFPLVDCAPWAGRGGFVEIPLDELSESDAVELLRTHGVQGSDEDLLRVVARYGRHALTLSHLAGVAVRYFAGDAMALPEEDLQPADGVDVASRRLASVLRAYESYLDAEELAVMQTATIFRQAIPAGELLELAARTHPTLPPLELRRALNMLMDYHLLTREEEGRVNAHPAVRDFFFQGMSQPAAAREARISQVRAGTLALAAKPGRNVRFTTASLNAIEEVMLQLHALGRTDEALKIWFERLGGGRHLGSIGEASRGLRILEAIAVDPATVDLEGYRSLRRRVGDLLDGEDVGHASTANSDQEARLLLGVLRGTRSAVAKMLRGVWRKHITSPDRAAGFQFHALHGWVPDDVLDRAAVRSWVDKEGNELEFRSLQELASFARNAGADELADRLRGMRQVQATARRLEEQLQLESDAFLRKVRGLFPPIPIGPPWHLSYECQELIYHAMRSYEECRDSCFPAGFRRWASPLGERFGSWYSGGTWGTFKFIFKHERSSDFVEYFGDARLDDLASFEPELDQDLTPWVRSQEQNERAFGHNLGELDVELFDKIDWGEDFGRGAGPFWRHEKPRDWYLLWKWLKDHDGQDWNARRQEVSSPAVGAMLKYLQAFGSETLHAELRAMLDGMDPDDLADRLEKARADLGANSREVGARLCEEAGFLREGRGWPCKGLDDAICGHLLAVESSRTSHTSSKKIAKQRRRLEEAQNLMEGHVSVEHQCLVDLVTARVRLDEGNVTEGMRAASHGRHLAREARYRILLVDLTAEVARAHLVAGEYDLAMREAEASMRIAEEPDCGYVWGACYAAAVAALAAFQSGDASAEAAIGEFRQRHASLPMSRWFEASLRKLGVQQLPG